jgi:hypothetical protein
MVSLFFLLNSIIFPFGESLPAKADHAVYVSVVELSYTSATKNGELSVKLFTDDFEDAIQNMTGERVKLTRRCEQNHELMEAYIREHLKLTINNQPVNFSISDCENVDIAIWLNFSFTCDDNWTSLKITGDQLMELFPTQSNVFSINYNDDKRMFRLTNGKKTEVLEFE